MIYILIAILVADALTLLRLYLRLRAARANIAEYDEACNALTAANTKLMEALDERSLDVAEAKARLRSTEVACAEKVKMLRDQLGLAIKAVESRGYKNKTGRLEHSREWSKLRGCYL